MARVSYGQILSPSGSCRKDVGPVVMEIPPAEGGDIVGTIMDAWQTPLEDVGPAGAEKVRAGSNSSSRRATPPKRPPGTSFCRRRRIKGIHVCRPQRRRVDNQKRLRIGCAALTSRAFAVFTLTVPPPAQCSLHCETSLSKKPSFRMASRTQMRDYPASVYMSTRLHVYASTCLRIYCPV